MSEQFSIEGSGVMVSSKAKKRGFMYSLRNIYSCDVAFVSLQKRAIITEWTKKRIVFESW